MLVISPQSMDALQRDYAPRAEQEFRAQLIAADRPLFGTLSPAMLDRVIAEARQQAEAVGLRSIGAAALFATLIAGSRGQPDTVAGFAPVLRLLRDTRLPEGLRIDRATAMLTDPEEDLPLHLRDRDG